jgi:histidyl-tRNA synthetase
VPWVPRVPWPAAAATTGWSNPWAARDPAIGFAIGFDRLAEIVAAGTPAPVRTPTCLSPRWAESCQNSFQWSTALGLKGIGAAMEYGDKSLKAQMKQANRLGAGQVLIVGTVNWRRERHVRNMADKSQREIPLRNR